MSQSQQTERPLAKIDWLRHKHIPRILDIVDETGHTEYTKQDLNKLLRRDDMHWLGYFHKGSLIGYVSFRQDEDQYEILDIAVFPPFQRKTIGKQLIEQVKQKVNCGSIDKVRVHIDERRDDLIAFITKACGFRGMKVIRGGLGRKWPRDRWLFGYDYQEPKLSR